MVSLSNRFAPFASLTSLAMTINGAGLKPHCPRLASDFLNGLRHMPFSVMMAARHARLCRQAMTMPDLRSYLAGLPVGGVFSMMVVPWKPMKSVMLISCPSSQLLRAGLLHEPCIDRVFVKPPVLSEFLARNGAFSDELV